MIPIDNLLEFEDGTFYSSSRAVPAELIQAYPGTGKLSSAIRFYSKRKREILFKTPQYMYAEVYFRFQSVMSI